MVKGKKGYFVFLGIPVAILGNLDLLLQPKATNGSLESWFIYSTFDVSSMFKEKSLILTMSHLIMMVLFLFLYGNYFSHDLHGTGIYYLARKKRRWSWYLFHVWKLFLFVVSYQFFYLASLYLLCMYHTSSIPNGKSLMAVLAMLLSMIGILFPVILIANILGAISGNVMGSFGGFLFLSGMVLACLHQNDIPLMQNHIWMRYFNPAYNMSLYEYGNKKYIIIAIFIWIFEVLAFLILGGILLNYIDIYGNQKEIEG